jgi:RNA polymerase sigma-70 factor (sigma-E family)
VRDRTEERSVDGDERDHFRDFVRLHSSRLLVFARLLTRNPTAADDLVQGVLVRCYPKWGRISRDGAEYAYVRRSILNAYLSLRRRPWQELPHSELLDMAAADDQPVEDRLVIRQALDRLTGRERAVIVLRYFEDLSEADTAAELGIRPGTVKSTTYHAMAAMRVDPDINDLAAVRGISARPERSTP